MNKASAQARILKLREVIQDYRYHYHVLDESIMSEAAADSLKHELSQLEEAFPELITTDSPTQRVAGQPLAAFTQVTHQSRMLSLNDVFSREEVAAWQERLLKLAPQQRFAYFIDIKMDGLACSLVYMDGVLDRAVTRGDGFIGEDVTMNIRTIENVPLRLRNDPAHPSLVRGRTEIRGEVVMYKADFEKLNDERRKAGKPLFANPRNLAAGTIRQLDPKLAAGRPLRFRAYDLLWDDPDELKTNQDVYQSLQALGLTVNREATVLKTLDEIMRFAAKWETARQELPFNTDGLVIKVNDRQTFRELGVVGKAPRAAVAYKYPAEEATTVVKDIVISIGRTGTANPVAVFEPVQVAGSTVQHATLHNADEVARKDIRVGDTVIIYKAGDIIPQVLRVLTELRPSHSTPFDMERSLRRQYPELLFERVPGEAAYRLIDASGPLLLKRALEHFASKGAMDIDTLGEKNVSALVDAGLVQDLADIYRLRLDQLVKLDRFATVSAQNLIKAVETSKKPSLSRFIYAIGIRHVGAQTAIDLADHFGSTDSLSQATLDELEAINGIGTTVAESIAAWFASEENQALLQKFKTVGVDPQHASPRNGPLTNIRFVITGTLTTMSRDAAAERIRSLGGVFQSSIAKDTNYLVVGEHVGASKLTKATQLGITQIDEANFIKILDRE